MFDLRYHVASLIAVFFALIVGILMGVGISGRGFVDKAERTRLNNQIADLRVELEATRGRVGDLERQQEAATDVVRESYPVLAQGRLADKRLAVVYVGSVDQALDSIRRTTQDDAGGAISRVVSFEVPLEEKRIQELGRILERRPALARYAGAPHLEDLGRAVGREIMREGETPVLDAISSVVEQRTGNLGVKIDGAVIVRSAPPQRQPTAAFVRGLYAGLAAGGVPAVGVEPSKVKQSAVPAFARSRLSTVDSVDTPPGRLALVLLLGGAQRGHYGVRDTATDGILPPIEPAPTGG